MKGKVSQSIEMLFVYIAIVLIAAFSGTLVSLGGSIPVKMAITLLVYAAMAGIPFLICRLKKIQFSELGFSKEHFGKQILIGVCIFIVTICFTVIIPLLIGMDKSDVLDFKSSSAGILIFYMIYDFLFVGFGEEFIFRGYFANRLGTATNSKLLAILLSSLLFGLWHYPHNHNILQVIVTAMLGLLYGFSRYKIKNCTLLSVSVAHGLQDTVIMVLSYLLL